MLSRAIPLGHAGFTRRVLTPSVAWSCHVWCCRLPSRLVGRAAGSVAAWPRAMCGAALPFLPL
ncbi:hypothetical protein TIFTF001_008878 [Ficus carica]|uniref:Uncharacterized protein n=1 Tax=Ficus carica TaxID=3494 RepID=A0AA88A5T5_FICCA|nr:hypothetical protein TIFTF001_008878 [Ficus carica]